MTGRHAGGHAWSRPLRRRVLGTDLRTLPRRSASQAGPLALLALLVALGTGLVAATPRVVARVEDEAVRAAVADAGTSADLVLSGPVGYEGTDGGLDRDPAATAAQVAGAVRTEALTVLGPVLGEPVTTEVSRALPLQEVGGDRPAGAPDQVVGETSVRLVWQGGVDAAWSAGVPPGHGPAAGLPGSGPQVGLSQATADVLGAGPGSVLVVRGADGADLDLRVTGVFRTTTRPGATGHDAGPDADPDPAGWVDAPELLEPRVSRQGPATATQVAVLLSDASLPDGLAAVGPRDVQRVLRVPVLPDTLTAARADAVIAALPAVQAAPAALGPAASSSSLFTGLDEVLVRVRSEVTEARAQTLALGVAVGVATSAVLVLAAGVLARRREVDLVLRRARGAALPATLVELGAEAVLVAGAGAVTGAVVAELVVPGPVAPATLLPALVTVVAVPGAALLVVRGAGDPPRAGAGAPGPARGVRDTGGAAGRPARRVLPGSRRAAAEGVLLLGAALAVVARRSGATDLLAAAAPTLVAAVAGVVVSRTVPVLLRAAAPAVARARGAVPVLGLARAREAGAAPAAVLCLTLCTALVVAACSVVAAARRDAEVASWAAVGGDVVVRADPDAGLAAAAARWADATGVVVVVPARVADDVQAGTEQGRKRVRVVVARPDAVERLGAAVRAGGGDPGGAGPGGERVTGSVTLTGPLGDADRTVLALDLPAPSGADPGAAARPTVVVDAAQLDVTQGHGDVAEPDTVWLAGPGAARAVRDDPPPDGASVVLRADVLAERGSAPLPRARLGVAAVAGALLLGLSVLAALQAAAVGGPGRRRALDTLRTIGLDDSGARSVAVAELLPAAAVSVLLGGGTGLAVATVLTGADSVRATLPWLLGAAGATALAVVGAVVALAVAEHAGSRAHRVGAALRIPEP